MPGEFQKSLLPEQKAIALIPVRAPYSTQSASAFRPDSLSDV